MKLILCIVVLKFFTEIQISDCSNYTNLIAVVQLFRHGQRTPFKFYPNDPFSDSSYWAGLKTSQLTEEGKRQVFDLGKFTRRRYQHWLPKEYNAKDFIAWTTHVKRTYLSTKHNIKGLYPSTNQGLIPIYLKDPYIFNSDVPKTCMNYYRQTANYMALQNFSEIYDFLTDKSGENVSCIFDVHLIYDCLDTERRVGLTLPSWTNKIYPEPLTVMEGLYFDSVYHTPKQQRMLMGPWLNEVLEHLENMAKNSSSSQKFVMYGGHDSNIACVLNMFKAYNPPFPIDVSSSMYFELSLNNGHYYVNVWFKDSHGLRPIKIRECDFSCPLEDIRKVLQDVVVDVHARNAECSEFVEFTSNQAKNVYKKLL